MPFLCLQHPSPPKSNMAGPAHLGRLPPSTPSPDRGDLPVEGTPTDLRRSSTGDTRVPSGYSEGHRPPSLHTSLLRSHFPWTLSFLTHPSESRPSVRDPTPWYPEGDTTGVPLRDLGRPTPVGYGRRTVGVTPPDNRTRTVVRDVWLRVPTVGVVSDPYR